MISGYATDKGTANFAKRLPNIPAQNFTKTQDLMLSDIGIGTYLGEADAATDKLVCAAIKDSVLSGVNVIDTAINYRAQKAERCVGTAVSELISDGAINRNEIFISSKNGYVTNDADIALDFWPYVNQEYVKKGVIGESDISTGYHCMAVKYLEAQLEQSLKNLGLDCIDLMYLHNGVEGQIKDMTRQVFLQKLEGVFQMYEQKRRDGKIRYYGMATWESFRVTKDNPQYFPLDEILSIAKKAGGPDHGFRFIQLPFNMHYDQAMMLKNHILNDKPVSVLDVAQANGIGVFTSVPFMQGRLLQPGSMPQINDLPANLGALQFIRSAPAVIAPLVGQKTLDHVAENLKIMEIPRLSESDFADLVKKLTS